MNASSDQPTAPGKGFLGCLLKTLIALLVLVISVAGCILFALIYTAFPFKTVASMIERGGASENLRISGISGSLSSGIGIQSVQWTGGELADVRVTYSGLVDLVARKELILHEVHVGKAHLDIANEKNDNVGTSNPSGVASTPSPTAKGQPLLKLIQIDRLSFADVLLTNSSTGFSLAIPAFEMTGMKAENGRWEFGQMKADTDRLKIVTTKPQSAAYQNRVEVTLLPKLHPMIRQPIHFTIDVSGDQSNPACRLSAFDGKLTFEIHPDHTGALRCSHLDLADFFDAPLPQDLTLDLSSAAGAGKKGAPLKIGAGSFKLGVRAFQIKPGTFGAGEAADSNHLVLAVSRSQDDEISYELLPQDTPGSVNARLVAKPPLSPQDTVARVFFGNLYSELQPADQKSVDQKLPLFSGSPQKSSVPNPTQ